MENGIRFPRERGAGGAARTNRDAPRAYTYRPGAAEGGEAAAEEEGRGRFEWFRRLFESLEEKGANDVTAAKRAAVALKKLKEHRHAIITVLLLLVMTAGIVFGVYKDGQITGTFRLTSNLTRTSDELGLNACAYFQRFGLDPREVSLEASCLTAQIPFAPSNPQRTAETFCFFMPFSL